MQDVRSITKTLENSTDANQAIKSLQDFIKPLSDKEALEAFRSIAKLERSGAGTGIQIFDKPDNHFLVVDEQHHQELGYLQADQAPAQPSQDVRDAASELLKMPGFADKGTLTGDIPYHVTSMLQDTDDPAALAKQYNKALEDAGSNFRLNFARKDNLPGPHGKSVYEEVITVTDRSGKQTSKWQQDYDSVRYAG